MDVLAIGQGGFADYIRMSSEFIYLLPEGLPNEYLHLLLSPTLPCHLATSIPVSSLRPCPQSKKNRFETMIDMRHHLCVRDPLCGQQSRMLISNPVIVWQFLALAVWYILFSLFSLSPSFSSLSFLRCWLTIIRDTLDSNF